MDWCYIWYIFKRKPNIDIPIRTYKILLLKIREFLLRLFYHSKLHVQWDTSILLFYLIVTLFRNATYKIFFVIYHENNYKCALISLPQLKGYPFKSGISFDRHSGWPKIIIKIIINVRPKAAQIFWRPLAAHL